MKKTLPPVYLSRLQMFSKSIVLWVLSIFVVQKSVAQQWSILGNESQVAATASSYTAITVAGDVPYVVYREGTIVKVKRRNAAGAWEQVGGDLSPNATYSRIYLDKQGNLFVSYVDAANGNKLAVKTYNAESGAWEPLNNSGSNLYVSAGSVNNTVSQYSSTPRSAMAFDSDNNPYIAFGDGSNLTPYVKKFDGTSWVTVGAVPVNAAAKAVGVTLVIDEADIPWLAYVSLSTPTSTTGSMALCSYSNGLWTPATATTISGIRHTSMALNSAGNLSIAYFNTGNSNKATVVVYNKTAGTWSSATSLSSRDAPNLSLISDLSGNLYCSFIDFISSTPRAVARVFKQSAGVSTWRELKDPSVTTGIDEPVGNLTIATGSDTSKPVIVYTKNNSAGVSTPVVRQYIPPAPPAVLTSSEPSNIVFSSAVAGGDITSDGGYPVTERGVVYGTTPNPTTANSKVVAASGGTGPFSVTLTGLAPSTYYYVRAYAINGGTSYGNTVNLYSPAAPDAVVTTPKQMEYLDRGLVAVRKNSSTVYLGWRLLGTDPSGIAFNVYRDGVKLNTSPITSSTNYEDNTTANGTYIVKPVINGVEGAPTSPVSVWAKNQLTIPLQIPPGGTTPDGQGYTYSANDASVGDMDGDGVYEIVLRWEPSVKNDNAGGYSGNQIFDCYRLDGTHLWRIDLGINMNAGPHFNPFMVYDFDGDGKAEVILKTADGTIDGTGKVIGDPTVDYRNSAGWVQQGPEFLTVFNGLTGAAMATVNYEPARGSISDWGDNYGNRADRFVSAVAYLDGARPSIIVGRGYYNKLVRAAYDWRDGKLTLRWKFDSKDPANPGNDAFSSMGNHQMTVGDVDGDGKDEIINGSSAINDNGKGLWTTGKGHGDALHLTDLDPDRPGQEVWINLESPSQYTPMGLRQYDAKTGATNWGVATTGDVGRSLAADIDPNHKGYEMWGSSGHLYDAKGNEIASNVPTYNFGIWWDGDLGQELLDGTKLDKWNPATNSLNRMFTIYQAAPVSSNNSTKANPCLQADLFGDWREEMIFRYSDNTALVIFTTTYPTTYRIPTLMHDPQYRTAVAWQNSGYNQPPYPSFYLGYDMPAPPTPNIVVNDIVAPRVSTINRQEPATAQTNAASVTYRVVFTENVNGVDAADFTLTTTGTASGTINSITAAAPGVYDITVTDLAGEGDLRLDVKESGTGITDASGNALNEGFTAGETYTIDRTAPVLSPVTLSSSNGNPAYAKEGDVITLQFTASEAVDAPVVTIGGHPVSATAGESNGYTATYTLTAADAEGPVAFTIDVRDRMGNAGAQGTTTDKSGVVYDRTKPQVSVNAITVDADNGRCEATVVSLGATTEDNVGVASVSNDAPNSFPVGSTTVTWTVTDAAGNSETATQAVTVRDAQQPVLTVPSSQLYCYTGNSYTVPALTASDNCGVASASYTITGATVRSGSDNDASGSFNTGVSTITWTVTDVHNNIATGSTTVTVNAPLNVRIPDVYAVSQFVDAKNTLYTGYGPSSIALSATPSGGTAPYMYRWTPGQATQSIAVTAAGVYSVTITDAKGCSATASITISVLDVTCGNNNDKVMVCHNGMSICVASAAVQEHLNHGDRLGSCAANATITTAVVPVESTVRIAPVMAAYPNPSKGQLAVELTNFKASNATVMIVDLNGRIIAQRVVTLTGGIQTVPFNIAREAQGMYLLKVISEDGVQTAKVILQK